MTENQEQIFNSFRRKIRESTLEEPPEIQRKIDEHIWDLFGDEEVFKDPPEFSATVKWSDEENCYMAIEHNRDISAFADTPANAMRELATAIELRQQVSNQND
jgi:hypothetical protein